MSIAPHTRRQILSSEHSAARVAGAPRKIGLLAGWGRFPLVVAEALEAQGCHVYGLGIRDHADPQLASLCDEFSWVGLARLGSAIRFFRRHGVSDAIMAGKVRKVDLYRPWMILHYLPDWRTVRTFYPHFLAGRHDQKDDTLLGAIVRTFAQDGIQFGPATDYVPELLVKTGCLTRCQPTAAQAQRH